MTVSPDELTRCHCGSSTYLVPNTDSLRTCSMCGYLTSFCKCKKTNQVPFLGRAKFPSITDRTRAVVGAAVVSSLGTLFAVALFSSPFLAVFGLGLPFGLNLSFFVTWLRDRPPMIADGAPSIASQPSRADIRHI